MITASSNAAIIARQIDRLRADVTHPRPAMKLAALVVQGVVQRHFREQKDASGAPWKELTAATIARRRNRSGASVKILMDTMRLFNSLNTRADDDEFAVGSNVIYGPTHNFGDPDRNIAQREFLAVNEGDERRVVAELDLWVRSKIGEAGLR